MQILISKFVECECKCEYRHLLYQLEHNALI